MSPSTDPGATAGALPGACASIVTPLYNRETLIPPCLDSLLPALRAGVEVIVVDDGSRDGSVAAVERFIAAQPPEIAARMRCLRQENAGPGAARNAGAAASTRDWILFVDSDDLWLPWTAERLLELLADPAFAAATTVFLRTDWFETGGPPPSGWQPEPSDQALYPEFFTMRDSVRAGLIGSGYFAVRRAVLDAVGGFAPRLRGAEDMDLFFRLPGPVARIHAPVMVAARKDNDDSLTRSMSGVIEGLRFMLRALDDGRYGAAPRARAAIADALQFWLRSLFNEHHGAVAYELLLRRGALRLLLAEGRGRAALKLMLHPLLSLVRPRNYRFGWRPRPQ